MLATLLIVFREIFEAGLIVGIVLAATRGVPARGIWISFGVIAGVAGACVVAAFAGEIGQLFQGSGQELFNATVLMLAVVMLAWHNIWMASHGREIAADMKRIGAEVAAGDRPLFALAVVCGLAVLREGSEVVLFLYGVLAAGGTSLPAMALGGALGVVAGMAVSALMYRGLLAIPARYLFRVTSVPHHPSCRGSCRPGRRLPAAGGLHRDADLHGVGHVLAAAGGQCRRPSPAHPDRLYRPAQRGAARGLCR